MKKKNSSNFQVLNCDTNLECGEGILNIHFVNGVLTVKDSKGRMTHQRVIENGEWDELWDWIRRDKSSNDEVV